MLEALVQIIKSGGLVAFPTETVYGLGADAWNTNAIRKIFEAKGRPADNPLIVHVSNASMVLQFAESVHPEAQNLIDFFWPGPLTLIFRKRPEVPDMITAGLDTVAIRMPNHKLALDFINQTGPLVAPSANISGRPSPTKPEHVKADFGESIPVIDGGICDVGIESTVLDVSTEPMEIYRPGFISAADIEKITGYPVLIHKMINRDKPKSPGMKYSHYAPVAKVSWMKKGETLTDPGTLYLVHSRHTNYHNGKNIIAYRGDYRLFTKELYDRFRQADLEHYKRIVIEPFDSFSENESEPAVLNRIRKAIGNG